MRIAFLLGEFPALSETFILDQITALIDRGHRVSIFAERRSRDAAAHPAVLDYDLLARTRYECLPSHLWSRVTGLPALWRWRRPAWRALNVFRYGGDASSLRLAWAVQMVDQPAEFDIIQCHFGALGLKAVRLREVGAISGRIVTSFHGEDVTNYPRQFPAGHYTPLFAHGDLFLPISARWHDDLALLGCPMDRVRVHRMGVDLAAFPTRVANTTERRPLRILSVARMVEKKGLGDAIRAVAQLGGGYEYVLVGDGPLRESLQALARGLPLTGTIRFTGPLTRRAIVDLLQTTDIFLAPSVTARNGDIEGIPVAIMEAMATGIPVVSTRHSGIPELVDDATAGFLVAEGDVPALTDRLSQLIADPALRARMGAEGRAIISRDYDVRSLTDRLVSHYEQLLCAPPSVGRTLKMARGQ